LAVNNKNQLFFARSSMKGAADKKAIMLFDLADEGKAEKTVVDGAANFKMSSNGRKIMVARDDNYTIHNAAASAGGKKVVTKGMNVQVDQRAEWRQVFHDSWRIFRDYFYDQGMHGVNWTGIRDHYAPMIDDCANRDDVTFVIREMIAELNCSHTSAYGPPAEKEPEVETGMLGVDFELVNGAYRIARIHEGASWQVGYRNPLRAGGVNVSEGEYLLAVNGSPINIKLDPCAAFVAMAGNEVTLTVSKNATLDELARDVVVVPVTGERAAQLRYHGWIEANRRHVDEKSSGKVGYIYIPDYGPDGLNLLIRQFYSQLGKKALIIDQRWNGGGWNPDRFLEILNRPASMYRARRDGMDNPLQRVAHLGPKCMLMNGLSGSSGDFFPWMFRDAGLGKLIGTRTWGGVVGLSGNPSLIDGHTLRVPTAGSYELDGTWIIEGHGVDPDFEVFDDPSKMLAGEDPQLDFAITHMLSEIKKNGYSNPKRPEGPNRKGMGVKPEDK
jgi:tricorn protease